MGTGYTCTACARPAALLSDGRIVRSCTCTAPIAAHLGATVSQSGGIAPSRGR